MNKVQQSLSARLDTFEARFDRLESLILANLTPEAPAVQVSPSTGGGYEVAVTPKRTVKGKPFTTTAQRQVRKGGKWVNDGPKRVTEHELKPLSKKSREEFIKSAAREGYDFAGWSTKRLAEYCVKAGYAPQGFCIGEGYTALFS